MNFFRRAALLLLTLNVSCTPQADDIPWTVVEPDRYLGDEHGEDELGEYFAVFDGLALRRGDSELVLVYQRWPDDLGQIIGGDQVHIDSDLTELHRDRWGYRLDDVQFRVVQRRGVY